jgi:4-amino-4-deoxy-L-arabinose transferase-like glycosyltransferase
VSAPPGRLGLSHCAGQLQTVTTKVHVMETGRGPRSDWVLLAVLTLLGLGLRLAYMLRVPPFLDEYSSILTAMSILRTGGVPRLPSGVLYPAGSLFSYLEAAFIGLFGLTDPVARLPSLLISGLTLPILYVVARNLLNRRVALLSVALLALTPEAVVWGGRARMYTLLQLLVLLLVYFFFRSVLDKQPDARARPAWTWVVCFLAAIFAQDEAILLLPILWLAALAARGPRWFLRPAVLLGQVLVPVVGVATRYWLNEIRVPGDVYTLTHDDFLRFPPALAHGLKKVAPFFTAPWAWPTTLFFFVALVFLGWDIYATRNTQVPTGPKATLRRIAAPAFLAYVVLAVAASIVLVVNNPWQDDRYLFMVLPLFLMVAAWGLDQVVGRLAWRWPALSSDWATIALVVLVAAAALPAGLSALRRTEPDYSAAYRWVATRIADGDLVATMRPAPAAVYLGRADYLVAEDKHREFIMRVEGAWVDRWAGAKVIESPEAFRDGALRSGRRIWYVIDEDRLDSEIYSPEFVALILQQMDLVWRQGGVLVFKGEGYRQPPEMEVMRALDADFGDQLRLTGYRLSTDRPEPGQEVTLQLLWQAIRPERNYTVFVHVVGADGMGLTQLDGKPLLGLYDMTTHWPRDRAVIDERHLMVPADTPPDRYRLEVGLYDADDGDAEPLPVLDTDGMVIGRSLTLDFLHVDVPPPPEPSQPVARGELGGVVRLLGYDLPQPSVEAGSTLPLTLTWESLASFDADYTVFVHLVGSDGTPLAQTDSQPLDGTYPTRYWDVGDRLADSHELSVPSDVPPGEYELYVGMYLPTTGERLLAASGGDLIRLTHVNVEAP